MHEICCDDFQMTMHLSSISFAAEIHGFLNEVALLFQEGGMAPLDRPEKMAEAGVAGKARKTNRSRWRYIWVFFLFVCLLGSSHVTVWILLILVLRCFRVSDYNYFLEHFKTLILQCSILRWLPKTLILTVCRISWRRIIIYCRLFIKLCELPLRNDSLLTKSDYKCTFSCTLLFT